MNENLIGYALDALEDEERQALEAEIRQSHELESELEAVYEWLEPLAADECPIEPPAGLCERTMTRIAEAMHEELPRTARALPRSAGSTRSWYRRADILVAAGIVLCLLVLLPPALNQVRYRYEITSCQNNLHMWWDSLQTYCEAHHGQLPDVSNLVAEKEKQAAGVFVAALAPQSLSNTLSVTCPATAAQPVPRVTLDDVNRMKREQFDAYIKQLAMGYAYSLGYADESGVHGLRFDPNDRNNPYIPVMADTPAAAVRLGDAANSPNHGGRGQNILYLDGHSTFWTKRTAGVNGDDIYVNLEQQVAAGKNRWDAVLATADARP